MSRSKVVAVVVVAASLVVWSVHSFVVDDASATTPTAPVVAAEAPAVTRQAVTPVAVGDVHGVPVGYPNTRAGAATAAVNWVASLPRLMALNPLSLQTALGELLSVEVAADGIEEVLSDYFELFDELGPEFFDRVWIESPLQTSVTATASASVAVSAVSVAVWSVLMTGGDSDTAVVALWRTHRIEVVWEHDDWKIHEVVVTEGPTPVTSVFALPSDPSEFVDVASWVPAVFADTTTAEMD